MEFPRFPRRRRPLLLAQVFCAAAVIPPVTIAPIDGSWLQGPGGDPLFVCGLGDPEDFLYRGVTSPDGTRRGEQDAIIARLGSTGANGIYIQAVRSHGGDGDRTHNPFVDHDPSRGLNPAVLEQWRGWLSDLDAAGVVTFFFVYDDGACIWGCDRDQDQTVPAEERSFLESLARSFPDVSRLVWVVAEEYQERFSAARVSAIAEVLRDADPRGRPVAVHQLPGTDFDFADGTTPLVFAMQYGSRDSGPKELHDGVVKARSAARGRFPVVMSEVPYRGVGTGEEARLKVWAMAMGGAYVLVNGWDGILTPRARLRECADLIRFFESVDPRGLGPRDDLALGATEYVLAAQDGRRVLYTSRLGQDRLLGLRDVPEGRYDLRWLDPRTGIRVSWEGVPASGDVVWRAPVVVGPEVALAVLPVRGASR